MAFDERENLEISSNKVFIQEYKSIFEKLTDLILKNRVIQILTSSFLLIIIILFVNRLRISSAKSKQI